MLRRLWQSGMIKLAHSGWVTRFMQENRATSFLSVKYVAGVTPSQAINKSVELLDKKGVRVSYFYLGEYVDSIRLVELNVRNIIEVAKLLNSKNLDIHISVDPTQIGFSIDESIGYKNALDVAKHIRASSDGGDRIFCIMLDMEDYAIVDKTISLHNELKQDGFPAAITLQAYLKRTESDIRELIETGSIVRLVKGAFTASSDVSYTKQKDIKANYYKLVELMLSSEAREKGFYPIIATHDTDVQKFSISEAKKNGWKKGEYEFEMLLGVRTDVAEELSSDGERVRLYMPFGKDWWPYAVRRIGENPRNALLLARSLID